MDSKSFQIAPIHLHPLLSELVKFIAEFQGLFRVKILSLYPYPENLLFKGSQIAEIFNQYLYSKQNYSVIGYQA